LKLLLAIDDSPASVAATNTLVKEFTASTTHVDVLHVDEWPRNPPASMVLTEGATVLRRVLNLHQARRRRAAALLAATAEQLRGSGFSTSASLRKGDVPRTIVECAKEWGADVIVLGSNGARERIPGSVSESVAQQAPCPVQIVRRRAAA
jgi:nucleotide-binding universal stress UspA family protein